MKRTTEQISQLYKSTALNAIRKLYNPKTKHNFTYYEGEGSRGEQTIIQLEKDLINLKRGEKDESKI